MAIPKKNPYNKYKETEISTANQGKLIVMLYDGAIRFLNTALENMSPKTYDVANNNILKAQDIITELTLSLNLQEGNDISQNLLNLYIYFKKRLIEANIKKDSEIIKEIMKYLRDLRDAWEKISSKETMSDKKNFQSKGSFSIEG
jgi:flagellar secretion chaperone FliS